MRGCDLYEGRGKDDEGRRKRGEGRKMIEAAV
jgi:hypothetical protein